MTDIINHAFDLLFGCTHGNLSRVFSVKRRTYKVCCDCGREFEYSLDRMCIVEGSETRSRRLASMTVPLSH